MPSEMVQIGGLSTDDWKANSSKVYCLVPKLDRILTTDGGMGVIRHVDAGYAEAEAFARKSGIRVPMWEV